MESQVALAVASILVVICLVMLFGYLMNIVKFFRSVKNNNNVDRMFVARIFGIVVPLFGAVIGYM